ncbi:MAG: carboxylating nicotinate-nucleotide diphosphorylase [bacterium]
MNLKDRLQAALEEDIGSGDVTSQALIPINEVSRATLFAKAEGVLAGLPVAMEVFRLLDPQVKTFNLIEEGDHLEKGVVIGRLEARTRAILAGERTALNLLQRLCGVATLTARLCAKLEGTRARLLDTRKTTPLWRDLEKYAVRIGGGRNHRLGLYDMILIKDNHIAAAGGISPALKRARAYARPSLVVEIEVKTILELEEALAAGADWIMLDNMSPEMMRRAVERTAGRAVLEASGGVNEETIAAVAATGVDYISVGALTHSAAALDISLEIEENDPTISAERADQTSGG